MTHELYITGITQVKAYRILQARVAKVIKANDFGSVTEWFVLSHVYQNEKVMAKDLAALLEVEAPLITRLIDCLQERKLVTVGKSDTDKRVRYIIPTKQAGVIVPKVQKALEEDLATLLDGIKQSDMHAYKRVLDGITKNSEK